MQGAASSRSCSSGGGRVGDAVAAAAAAAASTRATRAESLAAHSCSGVMAPGAPLTHAATSARASRRSCATSGLSCKAARCRAVLTPLVRRLWVAPSARIRLPSGLSPAAASAQPWPLASLTSSTGSHSASMDAEASSNAAATALLSLMAQACNAVWPSSSRTSVGSSAAQPPGTPGEPSSARSSLAASRASTAAAAWMSLEALRSSRP
mmetsp:Transcript_10317/g.32075  ORF Transcript_10317/g.32075 Transcript_10317/m.32075 type:complete len:209 (-) Transcript_10317:181-807(-)